MKLLMNFSSSSAPRNLALAFATVFFLMATGAHTVFASTSDGTIDTTNRYAWSENTGWIDFGSIAGNVHVTDSALTGAAYGENIGWIILNPAQGGVLNDGAGNLSGYAWSENTGWVDFSRVTVGSDGVFAGSAYGENIGWITFGATNNLVSTDWRPTSSRRTASPARPHGGSIQSQYQALIAMGKTAAAATLAAQYPQFFPGITTTTTTTTVVSAFMRDLTIGSIGADVQRLQQFLNTHSFSIALTGAGSSGSETTYFGLKTKQSLAKFQAARGIVPAVGYFGPKTRATINNFGL